MEHLGEGAFFIAKNTEAKGMFVSCSFKCQIALISTVIF